MSSTLINVGTEPNDGTGDPPRTSFSKVNANFQAIDQALAATETTAQLDARDTANRARENHTGTQPPETIADFEAAAAAAAPVQSVAGRTGAVTLARADVGLGEVDNTSDAAKPLSTATEAALAQLATSTQDALDLKLEAAAIAAFETNAQLDSRDTANRNRANHTGTQPASSVSGLAAVATSGAYADLSGNPATPYGFTYDQQAEPSAPAAGATWRERSAGGLIIGQWEWSGSLWLSIQRFFLSAYFSGLAANSTPNTTQPQIPRLDRLLIESASWNIYNTTGLSAANFWRLLLEIPGGIPSQSLLADTRFSDLAGAKDIGALITGDPTGYGIHATRAGTPGSLSARAEVVARRVRG
jgi:hypothetical protein